jgi:hypothetical protein
LAQWQVLKQELAAASPLTDRQRDLWSSGARPVEGLARANYQWRAVAVATAAAAFFVLFFWWLRRPDLPPQTGPGDVPAPTEVTVVAISPKSIATELSPLEQRLDRMERELAALSQRAELADLKRQTATLLEEYRRW